MTTKKKRIIGIILVIAVWSALYMIRAASNVATTKLIK